MNYFLPSGEKDMHKNIISFFKKYFKDTELWKLVSD